MIDQIAGVPIRDETFLLECDCNIFQHAIHITKYPDPDIVSGGELHFQFILRQNDSFWERLKNARKYVLTSRDTFVSSDTLIDYTKATELQNWIAKGPLHDQYS